MNTTIIGIDTETKQGPPITFQFFSKDRPEFTRIIFLKKQTPSEVFFQYLDDLPETSETYVLYGHNLKFDFASLLYDQQKELKDDTFNFNCQGWNCRGVYAGLVFANLRKGRKTVQLRDTWAFYHGSLAQLEQSFGLNLPKLERPEGLGDVDFSESDVYFVKYAMRDAEIAYEIGKIIENWHLEYDIPQCHSIADMAAKIFKKKFVQEDRPIIYPGDTISGCAYRAYHGGKNLLSTEPGTYRDVYSLDINSAYPHAMTLLPSFTWKGGFRHASFGSVDRIEDRHLNGVYKVSGVLFRCKYPIFYRNGPGMLPLPGDYFPIPKSKSMRWRGGADYPLEKQTISGVWVTGYELKEALVSKEFLLSEAYGYYYVDPDSLNFYADVDTQLPLYTPMKHFAQHFFRLKNHEKDPIRRLTYKLVLNSLSGKFAETRKGEEDKLFWDCALEKMVCFEHKKAGSSFYSLAAALITGHCRSRIHGFEHKYQSLHTSTDGILTQIPPDPTDLGDELGDLKLEGKGTLHLVRNKLYMMIDDNTGEIIKETRHAFRGKLDDLINLIGLNKTEYEYLKCNTLKESLRRKLILNKFDTYKAKVVL